MAGMLSEDKKCCGYPRKRVAWCGVITLLIAVAVIVTVVILTRPPDDIETIEKNESDTVTTASEITVLRTATLSSDDSVVSGTLSLVEAAADNSYFLAVNDFVIESTDCDELEVRLLAASSTTTAADGLLVVPLTVDATSTVDFTEPLDADFDADLYDAAAVWCTTSGGAEEQLGTSADLVTPTTLDGGSTVFKQATLSGGSYTVEGLVQILGSSAIVDDALVTTYILRFQDIEVSSGPDVFLYLTTDPDDPDDVDAEGSLKIIVEGAERGTFSFTGNFSQEVPDEFVSPDDYVAAVVWCDQFSVFFGSGLFEDA